MAFEGKRHRKACRHGAKPGAKRGAHGKALAQWPAQHEKRHKRNSFEQRRLLHARRSAKQRPRRQHTA